MRAQHATAGRDTRRGECWRPASQRPHDRMLAHLPLLIPQVERDPTCQSIKLVNAAGGRIVVIVREGPWQPIGEPDADPRDGVDVVKVVRSRGARTLARLDLLARLEALMARCRILAPRAQEAFLDCAGELIVDTKLARGVRDREEEREEDEVQEELAVQRRPRLDRAQLIDLDLVGDLLRLLRRLGRGGVVVVRGGEAYHFPWAELVRHALPQRPDRIVRVA